MAAINARRLDLATPALRPPLIGVGWLVLDIVVEMLLFESYLFSLLLYLGALALIWSLDHRAQALTFGREKASARAEGTWLVPSLIGSPLALLVFFGFIVVPFLPTEPREVCERFLNTEAIDDARQYVTSNMYPTIEQLKRIEGLSEKLGPEDEPEVEYDAFQLTDEGEGPVEMGGYLVGCRTFIPASDDGDSVLLDGFFHLTNFDGPWKIDGWYVTVVNGEPTETE